MEDYYCPICFNKLVRYSGCGAVGYMCDTCKHLISRSKMLTFEQMEEKKAETSNTKTPEE